MRAELAIGESTDHLSTPLVATFTAVGLLSGVTGLTLKLADGSHGPAGTGAHRSRLRRGVRLLVVGDAVRRPGGDHPGLPRDVLHVAHQPAVGAVLGHTFDDIGVVVALGVIVSLRRHHRRGPP